MTVTALSSAGLSQYFSSSSNLAESQKAFQSLQSSLAAGNLNAARDAYKTYNQLNQLATVNGSSSSAQLAADMSVLGSALIAGNLAKARVAFAAVQSDLKTTPSQAMENASAAAARTVQWVNELLSLSFDGCGSSKSFNTLNLTPNMRNLGNSARANLYA